MFSVLLIGIGVSQPYVDTYTYSFIQFSTYGGGHLNVKATVESGKLRISEFREKNYPPLGVIS